MSAMLFWLSLLFLILRDVRCVQWSPNLEEGARLYTCEGDDVTLGWSITPETGEQIIDIKWLFHGLSDQMVALYSSNVFLPTPTYSQRVQHVPSAGLVLSHVTSGDSGRYTVVVDIDDAGGAHVNYSRTAHVHVATASTARVDATLQASQQDTAVYNNLTGQYHVQLTCTIQGQQPPVVIWMTPSERVLNSTDGSLLIPNPVTGGTYTCHLPTQSPPASCLPERDPVLAGASLVVDKVDARMTLMEAKLYDLKNVLRQENTALNQENADLKQRVHALESTASKSVMFQARLTSQTHVTRGDRLILPQVDVNLGDAYNSTTGQFTAPYSGQYFFTATTVSSSSSGRVDLALMVNGSRTALLSTQFTNLYDTGTMTCATYLQRGQRVWLQSDVIYDHYNSPTWPMTNFNGFLIRAD